MEGELLARELFDKYGMQGSVFRPLGIYGPRDTRFLKLFKGLKNGTFVMIGDGETLYHMTYIDDLCAGIELCATHPGAVGEVFILGGDHHVTLNELIASVARAVGGSGPRMRVPLWPVMTAAHVCEALLPAAGHRAAVVSAPGRMVHQGSRGRHFEGAPRARLHAARRSRRRHASHGTVVRRAALDVRRNRCPCV